MAVLLVITRLVVGGVFSYAGISKLRAGHSSFLEAVLGFDLLPKRAATVVAFVVPCFELAVGTLLLIGLETRPAALAALALVAVFTTAVSYALATGRKPACGCFGPRERLAPMRWTILVRNLALGTGILLVAFGPVVHLDLDAVMTGSLTAIRAPMAGWMVAVAALATLWRYLQLRKVGKEAVGNG